MASAQLRQQLRYRTHRHHLHPILQRIAPLHSIRAHWSVENQLHWSLDVAMREDAAQSYKDQSPHNQTLLRRMALQVLKNDTSVKIGLQAKRKRAGWSLGYLEQLLGIAV